MLHTAAHGQEEKVDLKIKMEKINENCAQKAKILYYVQMVTIYCKNLSHFMLKPFTCLLFGLTAFFPGV